MKTNTDVVPLPSCEPQRPESWRLARDKAHLAEQLERVLADNAALLKECEQVRQQLADACQRQQPCHEEQQP